MATSFEGLQGPYVTEVTEILNKALVMETTQASTLSRLWETEDADTSHSYLDDCQVVWKALESTGRHLPLGWFEEIFIDIPWTHTTRALHAVADAICASLVQDVIPADVYEALTRPWNLTFSAAMANSQR